MYGVLVRLSEQRSCNNASYSPYLRLYWDRAHRPIVLGFVHGCRGGNTRSRDHRVQFVRSRRGCNGRVSKARFCGSNVWTGDATQRSREGTRGCACGFGRTCEGVVGSRWQESARSSGEEPIEVSADAVNVGMTNSIAPLPCGCKLKETIHEGGVDMSFRSGILVFTALLISLPAASSQTPEEALWSAIRSNLLSEDGAKYFHDNILDALLPVMRGTVISADSSVDTERLVLSMSDKTTPEVTLQIVLRVSEKNWRPASFGRVTPGDEIAFMGVGADFTKNPFMLTLRVYAGELKHLRSGDRK